MKDESRQLDVYLLQRLVGKLISKKGELSFSYDSNYLASEGARSISISLPLREEIFTHAIVAPFFSGLLPDESVKINLARYLGISEKNTFELLKVIGGECAGAISLYPEGITPNTLPNKSYRVLNEEEADRILQSLDKHPLMAGEDNIRISGAGAQTKLMIAFDDSGKIMIPTGNSASTHIIKPAIEKIRESVFNEHFCMELARKIGLQAPRSSILWVKNRAYYVVERYDRLKGSDGVVSRLHQEDFCQALHIPPEIKYEDEGGPSLKQCFELLDARIASGSMSGKNKITLLNGVIFNYIIGNGDAHGKNFSLLYHSQTESLAPFYDLLCTMIYVDSFKSKMAMKIGGKYKFLEVHLRNWERLSESLGFRIDFVLQQMKSMITKIEDSSETLCKTLNSNHETASPIYHKIVEIIFKQIKRLN